jgi:hypothetical protein
MSDCSQIINAMDLIEWSGFCMKSGETIGAKIFGAMSNLIRRPRAFDGSCHPSKYQ